MHEFTVYAPAKLNLYLDVLEKRPDGYHNIETLFEKIDLQDEIIIREKKRPGLEVRVEGSYPCLSGKNNIVYKAATELLQITGAGLGLEIIVKKRIPVSAGLGGGSSDAAIVLRSLNERFNLRVSQDELFSIAVDIGKDVPFFLLDTPFAIGRGAGELLEQVDIKRDLVHIIARPDIMVATKKMYERVMEAGCNTEKPGIERIIDILRNKDIKLLKEAYYNKFDKVYTEFSSFIEKTKILLTSAGADSACLSGSGPAVFCTFEDKEKARDIFKKVAKDKKTDIFLVSTYRK